VIGDDDAVYAAPNRLAGVVGVQDALQQHGQARPLAQTRQVVPSEAGVAENRRELHHRAAGVFFGRGGEQRAERGVAEVVRQPVAVHKRQIGAAQIARTPRQHVSVHRHHDCAVARRLRTAHETRRDLVIAAPVELEPARRVAHRFRNLLNRVGRHRAECEGDAEFRAGARGRQLAVGVDNPLHAHWRDINRRGIPSPEQLDAPVALGDIAQKSRHNLPDSEGAAVGVGGLLRACTARHIVIRFGRHRRARRRLQRLRIHRELLRHPEQPLAVNLQLTLHACFHRRNPVGGFATMKAIPTDESFPP
jgi:hypothetical protein